MRGGKLRGGGYDRGDVATPPTFRLHSIAVVLLCALVPLAACEDPSAVNLVERKGPGSAPVAPGTPGFTELANVHTNTQPCGTDFSGALVDCYDETLPPAPSIRRSFVPTNVNGTDVKEHGVGRRQPLGWGTQFHGGDKVVDFPAHRASPDGRLVTQKDGWGRLVIQQFFPENLKEGMLSHPDRRVYAGHTIVPPQAQYFPPLTGRVDPLAIAEDEAIEIASNAGDGFDKDPFGESPAPQSWADLDLGVLPTQPTVNWDLCDGDMPEPVPCRVAARQRTLQGGARHERLAVPA